MITKKEALMAYKARQDEKHEQIVKFLDNYIRSCYTGVEMHLYSWEMRPFSLLEFINLAEEYKPEWNIEPSYDKDHYLDYIRIW